MVADIILKTVILLTIILLPLIMTYDKIIWVFIGTDIILETQIIEYSATYSKNKLVYILVKLCWLH